MRREEPLCPRMSVLNVTVLELVLGMTWLSFGLYLFCTQTEVLQVHPLEVHPGFENSRPGTWKSLQRGAEGTWGEEASSPGVRVLPVLNPACRSQGARARSPPHVGHTAQPTCSLNQDVPQIQLHCDSPTLPTPPSCHLEHDSLFPGLPASTLPPQVTVLLHRPPE